MGSSARTYVRIVAVFLALSIGYTANATPPKELPPVAQSRALCMENNLIDGGYQACHIFAVDACTDPLGENPVEAAWLECYRQETEIWRDLQVQYFAALPNNWSRDFTRLQQAAECPAASDPDEDCLEFAALGAMGTTLNAAKSDDEIKIDAQICAERDAAPNSAQTASCLLNVQAEMVYDIAKITLALKGEYSWN